MRVLVAHDVNASRTGGMSRVMGFIHDQLDKRGYDTTYLHAGDVENRVASLRRFAFPMAVWRHARNEARAGRPYDVVNIHEPSALPTIIGRRAAGSPHIVVTTHGVEQRAWDLALEEGRLGRETPGLKTRIVYPLSSLWQSRLGLRMADDILCLNEEDRVFLQARLGVTSGRITRIFPGADPLYADAAKGREYSGRATRLLFAATWRKNKGIEDLVPAFQKLLRLHQHLQLVVLGPGVSDETVRGAFPESTRQAVTCITARNDMEAARIFATSDIFLLPSLFEGTPLTLIEAMMSGLPIVTTSVCGMKDVIEDRRNGLLVPIRSADALANAVCTLVEEPTRRQALGEAARLDAQHRYTWARAADIVEAVYARRRSSVDKHAVARAS